MEGSNAAPSDDRRAFAAKDRKSIKLVAQNCPETPFYKIEQLLTELGIGEALVTVLDERGLTDATRRDLALRAAFSHGFARA